MLSILNTTAKVDLFLSTIDRLSSPAFVMPAKTPAKLRSESARTGHNITERKDGRGSDSSLQQQLSVESFAEIPKLISEITQMTSSLSELRLRQADGGRSGAARAAATCQKANSAVNYNRTVRLSDCRIIFIR